MANQPSKLLLALAIAAGQICARSTSGFTLGEASDASRAIVRLQF